MLPSMAVVLTLVLCMLVSCCVVSSHHDKYTHLVHIHSVEVLADPAEQPCPDGDENAMSEECPSWCQPTCQDPNPTGACPAGCLPRGCVCKPGFILSDRDGICIVAEDCLENTQLQEQYETVTCYDRNATFQRCPRLCQPTCEEPREDVPCYFMCAPEGCVCKPGYVQSLMGCILPEDCPVSCEDENSEYQECPSMCQPTCEVPEENIPCVRMCAPDGCVCKPGFLLHEGRCIEPSECPIPDCDGDRNATYMECPSMCQPTCEQPDEDVPCIHMCAPDGCTCKPGYVLNEGICILPQDCPASVYPTCADENAEYQECPSACQPTCEEPDEDVPCIKMCGPSGCVCKSGYVFSALGTCVRPNDCPFIWDIQQAQTMQCSDPNASYRECPSLCPPTCEDPSVDQPCFKMCAPPGCTCNSGFVLSPLGKCVLQQDCPVIWSIQEAQTMQCGQNATYRRCPTLCPPTCAEPEENPPCEKMCGPPGCTCNSGYVLSPLGECVRQHDCPFIWSIQEAQTMQCSDPQASYQQCPSLCPPTCEDPRVDQPCFKMCAPPGCACNSGYVLSPLGKCVLQQDCPVIWSIQEAQTMQCSDPHASYQECPSLCPPTCEDPSVDQPCFKMCAPSGCACNSGYVLSPLGKCVLQQDCPVIWSIQEAQTMQCSDPNASYRECPSLCPPTCEDPSVDQPCFKMCAPPGCACNSGFVLSPLGKCVLQQDCPVIWSIQETQP